MIPPFNKVTSQQGRAPPPSRPSPTCHKSGVPGYISLGQHHSRMPAMWTDSLESSSSWHAKTRVIFHNDYHLQEQTYSCTLQSLNKHAHLFSIMLREHFEWLAEHLSPWSTESGCAIKKTDAYQMLSCQILPIRLYEVAKDCSMKSPVMVEHSYMRQSGSGHNVTVA